MSLHHGLRSAAGASVADPYFANTSLLLLGNGVNGGQNNTFVDGSSNAFSVTRYGNTTQGTFSPFSAPDGYWSVSFDGSGDYLSVSNPSNLSFGTGAFTVEFWMNWSGATASPYMGVLGPHNGGSQLYGIFLDSSGNIGIYLGGSTFGNTLAAAVKPTPGKWMHIASCRDSSGVHRFYVDGVLKDTTTDTTNLSASGGFNIGVDCSSGRPPFSGQISNLRVLSSTALYTGSSITPSTSPLTAVSGTSLLTCQSNRFLDKSTNAATITPYGDARVTNFAPFPTNSEYSTGVNGGSGYFDGSGDALSLPINSSALYLSNSDFSFDCWVYWTASATAASLLAGQQDSSTISGSSYGFKIGTSTSIEFYSGSGTNFYITSPNPPLNAWSHIVVARTGGTLSAYLNGTRISTRSDLGTSSNNNGTTYAPAVGRHPNGYENSLTGYIANLRLLKGSGGYDATQSSITVPTSPLTAVSGTSLLLNFTNAAILDSTGKNDIETVGDAQISTSVKKFGTGSLKFDGTGDYLAIPSNSNLAFGTGDFTLEGWIYTTSLTAQNTILDMRPAGVNGAYIYFAVKTNGSLLLYVNTAERITSSSAAISTNTWYHVAVCRSGTSTKMFIDGSQVGSTWTDSSNYAVGNSRLGASTYDAVSEFFVGNIDDFRITKGVARFTANFTPPSRQLPAR